MTEPTVKDLLEGKVTSTDLKNLILALNPDRLGDTSMETQVLNLLNWLPWFNTRTKEWIRP